MGVKTNYVLGETEISKAIAFWLEHGMPEPKAKAASIHYHMDKPSSYHPTDHGVGLTATVNDWRGS